MKNFLKSTAIFACIALMFCACSEDTTVDGDTSGGAYIETVVEAPSDVVVQPGNGIAVVTFTAAEDEYISKCSIVWVNNDDAEDAGSRTISVEAGELASYTITGLKSGTYSVTVVSIMDDSNKTSEETTVEAAVYDESTYENQMPEITGMDYNSTLGVTIYLSYVTQDCTALEVSYYTYAGDYSSTTTVPVDIADPGAGTILTGAKLGENFTLVGYFQPEGGYDAVLIKSVDIFEAEEDIDYPTDVAADPGYKRMMVYWSLDETTASSLDATYISYQNTSDSEADAVTVKYTSWDFTGDNSSQKVELSGLSAGNYTVGVYNYREGDAQINILSIEDVLVYDESSFSLPAISEIIYKSDDKVYITWGDKPEHVTEMSYSYVGVDGATVSAQYITYDADGVATSTLESGAKENSEIIVSATFHPEYAIIDADANISDYVDVSTAAGDGTKIPEQLPVALSDLIYTMGYDTESEEDNKSQLNVSWTALGDDEDVSKIIIYYGVGVSPSSYESVEIEPTETSYTLSGLIKNVTYTGYVVCQKESLYGEEGTVISSDISDEQKFSLVAYDDVTYATSLPSYSVTNSLAVDVTFGTLSADLVSVTVTPDAGDAVTMTRAGLVEASNKLSFAQGEATSFTYSAILMPTYGVTEVVLTSETITIPEIQLVAPSDVAVEYGYDSAADGKGTYINVTWTAPTDAMLAYISGYKLYYTIGDGELQTVSGIAKDATSYSFENIADENLGEYTIYVAYVDIYDNDSVPCDELSAVAYGSAYYTTLPELMVIEADGVLTLSWGTSGLSNDIVSATYTYGTAAAVEVLAANFGDAAILNYEAGYNSVSYTATFCPADGVGNVVIAGEVVNFDEPTPTAPETLTVSKIGYNETDGSYATVTWTKPATSTSTIANYKAYANYDDGTATDVAEVAMSGDDNESYTFTNLDTDKLYTFYVASETEADTASAYTSVTAENVTYSPATYALPSVALAFCSDLTNVNISWGDVSESLVSVTTSYTNGADSTLETTTLYADIANGTTFAYTSDYTAFTYSASFKPSYGEDAVSVTGGEGTIVLSDPDLELTSDGTYNIYSAVGLAAFADLVNGTDVYYSSAMKSGTGFPEAGSSNLTINGTVVKDIDLSTVCGASVDGAEVSWTPISNYYNDTSLATPIVANIYKGTFDGGSYTISNLYINAEDMNGRGLFSYVNGATIKNVKLSNISISVTRTASVAKVDRHISGGLVGFATASTISDCEVVSGTITAGTANAGDIGGLVGRMSGGTTIENCTNRANINSSVQLVGGIVGNIYGGWVTNASGSTGTIKGCYNYGKITGTSFAAGIIGYFFATGADSTLEDCYNYGEVYCSSSNVGGAAGSIRASTGTTGLVVVSNCHNYAPVTSTSSTYIGGVTGQASTNGGSVTITGCSNNAAVTGAANLVGGVVGAEVAGTGTLTIEKSTNSGAIQGTTNVGGIVGLTVGSSVLTGDSSVVSNTGSVAATNTAGIAGGIVGTNTGTVTDYNNSGMVTMGGVNVNGTDVNGIYGSNSGTVESSVDSYVAAADAEAVTVSALALTDGVDGVVVSWAYGTDKENISSVVIYYKSSDATSYSSKVIEGNTDTTYTLSSEDGIETGLTYNVYVETKNVNGVATAATSGGTSTDPLSITLSTEDTSAADIKFVAAGDTYDVDTYEIYTAKGLGAFNDLVSNTTYYVGSSTNNESVIDTNNTITSWSKTVDANAILMADIDLSTVCGDGTNDSANASWTPIGTTGSAYAGTFDGNSKKISNLYIDNSASTATYQGLFGSVSGTVQDFTLYDPTVKAYTYVGAVAGDVTATGTISGVTVSAESVTAIGIGTAAATLRGSGGSSIYSVYTYNPGNAYTGGITGANEGTIIGCSNNVNVGTGSATTGLADSSNTGIYIGGIAGSNTATIKGSSNSGYVFGRNAVGGVVGNVSSANAVIAGCTNSGTLYSNTYTAGMVGQLAAAATVVACYSTGDIDGPSNSAIIGAIVGYHSTNNAANVIGCFSYKGSLGPAYAGSVTASATGYIIGTPQASMTVASCYYVDVADGYASAGIGSTVKLTDGVLDTIDITKVDDIAALVSAVATMNEAIGTDYGYQFSATTLNADGAPSIVVVE